LFVLCIYIFNHWFYRYFGQGALIECLVGRHLDSSSYSWNFYCGEYPFGNDDTDFGAQSLILGCVPFFMYAKEMELYIVIVSLAAIVLRGVIMPNFLFWAIRHVSVRTEISPLIG